MASEGSDKPRGDGLHRTLGVLDLVLLNIAAILGVRWLSTAAQLGPSALSLWLIAVVIFLIPSGLTVMELSSRNPGEGGIYLWSKAAFGELHGFIAGWTYWVNNLFYFPGLLLFIAGALLFLGGEQWLGLEDSPYYNAGFSLALLWLVIGANVMGLKRGKWIQNVGAMSTLAIFLLLLVCGIWAWSKMDGTSVFANASFVPNVAEFSTLTFFATMTFAFAGLELSSTMGGEIVNPERSIPRAMVVSGFAIAIIYIFGTAVLMLAVPDGQIDVITGIPQSLAAIGNLIALPGLAIVGALLVVFSSTGALGAWMAGVARIPFVIGIDRYLPKALGRTHPEWGTPHVALLTQGSVVTVLMLAAVAGSTIEEAYILLLDMTIILYFIPFVYMFAALPVLRHRAAGNNEGVRLVPGGSVGVWLVSALGLSATLTSIVLAMIPPAGSENPSVFVAKIVGGCVIFVVTGLLFYWRAAK